MRVPLLSSVVFAACSGSIQMTPPPLEVPSVTVSLGAPTERDRPVRSQPGTWTTPSALWRQSGNVVVLDGDVLTQRSVTSSSSLSVGTEGTPGAVKALSRRGDGVVLAGTGGFFHDAPNGLLRAPMSEDFSMDTVRFVDVVGAAIWVTTKTEAVRVLDGRRQAVSIDDPAETGELQVVVGTSESAALVIKGGSLYAADLTALTVTTLARGLSTVTAIDHLGTDTLIGTSAGLLQISASGTVTQRTLSTSLETAQGVVDVEVVGDTTLVTTSKQVLQVNPVGAVVLADVTRAWPDALTKDTAGDVWFLDGAQVVRLATSLAPPAPSFATDVKPFMTAHCRSCHATGANYAPQLDLETYATARTWAAATVTRLTSTQSPMPPASTETLTPAQYDVVVRWVEGGLLP